MREGRIFKRGTSWTFVVDLAPPGAPRQQRKRGGFATKREAIAAMAELQGSVARGSYVEPSRQTVAGYLQEWLPSARARLRPGAYDAVALHVRAYIIPGIGDVPLQGLTAARVKVLYAELAESGRHRGGGGLSAKTVHNIHRTLSRGLSDAVHDGVLVRNPAERCHTMPSSPEQATWDAGQVRAFLVHVAEDRLVTMWRIAATTGIRRGELVGLRWSDVDLEHGRLSISQQRAKGGGTVAAGPTKTRRSRRLVSIDPATVTALRGHRKRQAEERLLFGAGYTDEGLVFCREDGVPLHPDRVTQLFRRHSAAAGLPWIKVHGLRHTHATLMLQAGVHPKVVQERLGHSSIAITLDTYSHAIPAMQEDAADRLAALVDGTSP